MKIRSVVLAKLLTDRQTDKRTPMITLLFLAQAAAAAATAATTTILPVPWLLTLLFERQNFTPECDIDKVMFTASCDDVIDP